jgi:hypothetical protein
VVTLSGAGSIAASRVTIENGASLISSGTLALGTNSALSSSSRLIIGNSTLNAGTIHLGTGATLSFADSSAAGWTDGTLNITGAFVPGASLRFGNNGGGLLPAQLAFITVNGDDGPFALDSSGYLTIAASGNAFSDWLVENSPATGFTTDTDLDGISNGLENIFGTNPNAFNAGLTNIISAPGSVTFKHRLNPNIASDVSYHYEWSTDLAEWKGHGESNSTENTATIVASAPDYNNVVTVVITLTAGPNTHVFGRLEARQLPP